MEGSRIVARNVALSLSDIALAIEETLPIVLKKSTRKKGLERLEWLRKRIIELTNQPGASRSLRAYSVVEFDPEQLCAIIERLESKSESESVDEIKVEVEKLVSKTWDNLNEICRATRGFASPV